jgi:hypothetical protein
MATDRPHPPVPGPIVEPNLGAIEEAFKEINFPISKKDLLESTAEGATVLVDGKNVDLRDLLLDVHDDFFDSEEELHAALERLYATLEDEAPDQARGPISLARREGGAERWEEALPTDEDARPSEE